MKQVTLTELRRNLFRLVDEALETGEPILVNRKGQRVVIGPDRQMTNERPASTLLAARWRSYFDAPAEIEEGLTLQEIEEAGEAYWQPSDDPGADHLIHLDTHVVIWLAERRESTLSATARSDAGPRTDRDFGDGRARTGDAARAWEVEERARLASIGILAAERRPEPLTSAAQRRGRGGAHVRLDA